MTVRDALNSAIDEEMARDQSVYILGEEVTDLCPPCSSTRCPGLFSCCMLWCAGGGVPGRLQGQFSSRALQLTALSVHAYLNTLCCRSQGGFYRSMARTGSETHPSQRWAVQPVVPRRPAQLAVCQQAVQLQPANKQPLQCSSTNMAGNSAVGCSGQDGSCGWHSSSAACTGSHPTTPPRPPIHVG